MPALHAGVGVFVIVYVCVHFPLCVFRYFAFLCASLAQLDTFRTPTRLTQCCFVPTSVIARKDNVAEAMSDDHKPERPDEQKRIEEAGGHVLKYGDCYRVSYARSSPKFSRVKRHTPEDPSSKINDHCPLHFVEPPHIGNESLLGGDIGQ